MPDYLFTRSALDQSKGILNCDLAMTTRDASHAGSWYTGDRMGLSSELDGWLSQVPANAKGIGKESSKQEAVALPSEGARIIIAPYDTAVAF